jgi:hypothetical protein
LDIDISLAVTDDKDLLGSGLASEDLDVVGDVFGRNLGVAETSRRRGEPSDIVSGSIISPGQLGRH